MEKKNHNSNPDLNPTPDSNTTTNFQSDHYPNQNNNPNSNPQSDLDQDWDPYPNLDHSLNVNLHPIDCDGGVRCAMSTSLHSNTPGGSKSTYWFLNTNYKKTLPDCSYTYIAIDHSQGHQAFDE